MQYPKWKSYVSISEDWYSCRECRAERKAKEAERTLKQ